MNVKSVCAIGAQISLITGLCLFAEPSWGAVTDARVANLTSRSFDLFLRSEEPAVNPTLEVFTTPDGATASAATITELQPLFTGSTSGDDYVRRQANRATRAALTANGNTLFRVTNCDTNTSYYVRARFDNVVVWPTNGTLQAVQTLPAREWNGGARQYLVNLGRSNAGSVGLLNTPGAAAPILSVAGDRAATNTTLFFNLPDCMGTNGLPLSLAEGDLFSLTVYGKLGADAPATTLAAAAPAAATLVASADAMQKNILSLLVASAANACSPKPGEHLLFDGSMVTCRLEQTVITQVSTQFVGFGWAGSGNVPANGRTTSFTFAMTSDSSVDWRWRTNFWVEVVSDHGSVDLPSGWYRSGSALNATVSPNAEWLFSQWSGLASGTDPVASLVVGTPGQVRAEYAPVLVPGGNGMPEWWLTQAGLAGANRDPNADPDHDGMSNAKEWMADTSPTNKSSSLKITGLSRTGGLFHLTWRGGREARQVVEATEGDLSKGDWHPIATNLPPTETIGSYAIQFEGKPTLFFRIRAER